jgi:hypothetical protein
MKALKKEGESDVHYFFKSVGQASFAGMVGEVVTIPLDTAKVRL